MLIVIGGPMFAGKTTWLLDHITSLPPESFLLFKPSMDTRFATDACVTHDGRQFPAQTLNHKKPVFPKMGQSVKTVLIDELNFFSPTPLLAEIKKLIAQGRTVIGSGLLFDFAKKPFGATLPLSKKADRFIELFAMCDGCGQAAQFNYTKIALKGNVHVGAGEIYGACCDACWSTLSVVKG